MNPPNQPTTYAYEWHITVKADEPAGAIDALFNCIRSFQSGAEPIGGTCPASMGNRMTYDVIKDGKPTPTPSLAPTPRTLEAAGTPSHDWEATADRLFIESQKLERELAAAKAECEELLSVNATGAERLRFVLEENSRLRAEVTGKTSPIKLRLKSSTYASKSARAWLAELDAAVAERDSLRTLTEGQIAHLFGERMTEIVNRAEKAEAECLEQARLLGKSGEREADLLGKIERLNRVIERASVQFFHEGTDGETAAKMLTVLNETK